MHATSTTSGGRAAVSCAARAAVAMAVAAWTVSLGCTLPPPLDDTDATAAARNSEGQVTDAGALQAAAAVDGADATANISSQPASQGNPGTVTLSARAQSPDTDAAATGAHESCYRYNGDQPVELQGSLSILNVRMERSCSGEEAGAWTSVALDMQRNSDPITPVYSGNASIRCSDQSVAGNIAYTETIPGFRWVGAEPGRFFSHIFTLVPNDTVRAKVRVQVNARAGADEVDPWLRSSAAATYNVNVGVPGLEQIACRPPSPCAEQCPLGEICVGGTCEAAVFEASSLDVSTAPPTLNPGQSFSITTGVGGTAGTLLPKGIVLTTPPGAATRNGVPFQNQIVGNCTGPFDSNIVASGPNDFFVDIDAGGTPDPADAFAAITENPSGGYSIAITLPDSPSTSTFPVDVTVSCTLYSLFIAGVPGTHWIDVEATSLDPDTGGADDGAGQAPLTFSTQVPLFVQGTPAATATATHTGATPTHTPTPTPTPTPSATPTLPPPPTAVPTATRTPTLTPTQTPTMTPTPSTTVPPAASATPTLPPAPTPTPTEPPLGLHDAVVLPVKPVTVIVTAGAATATKKVKVKVRNADVVPVRETVPDTIALAVATDCPGAGLAGLPDFDRKTPGDQHTVQLAGGKTKAATVLLTVSRDDFSTFNKKAPARCTLTFTATTIAPSGSDPTPDNNVMQVELNVIDRNDPPQAAVHESLIKSIKPVTVKIPRGRAMQAKAVRPVVVNADFLPAVEKPGDVITVAAGDGTCPAGSVGVADYDPQTSGPQNSVLVKGGAAAGGVLPLLIDGSAFRATPNAKAPARCVALLTATGPGGDTDAANNTTKLTIDVIDTNDP